MSFPVRLSEITVDWLNAVLGAGGLLGARRVVGFDTAPASGRGGTSSVHVLTLTYDQPADLAPKKVLAKFSSESEAVREAVREHRLYQREIAFYAHYGLDPGIPTPACYASEYDERSNTCVLLLEYLENARNRDVHEGAPEDVEAAVRCLAPFHAKWWGREASLTFIESDYSLPALEKHLEKAARAFKRIQEGGHRGALGETSFAILELWLANARPLADYARSRPMTMCHGSFHRGQILFPERGAGPPWVIDWQNVSVNIGAHDLARIVVSGLLPGQRRQREPQLVALYHSLLLDHHVRDYPLDQLFNDYRLGIVSLVVFHSLILADYPVEVIAKYWKGRAPFWEMLFHWPGEAAEAWDALGWLKETLRPFSRGPYSNCKVPTT
jgi:aminoglycoside/choline kinase family phosphotransferase